MWLSYLLRQKNGVNKINTVKSSNLPISIKKEQNHFAETDKCAKLFTGLTEPKPGPILPKEEAAAPKAEIKSKPKSVNITDAITKISM